MHCIGSKRFPIVSDLPFYSTTKLYNLLAQHARERERVKSKSRSLFEFKFHLRTKRLIVFIKMHKVVGVTVSLSLLLSLRSQLNHQPLFILGCTKLTWKVVETYPALNSSLCWLSCIQNFKTLSTREGDEHAWLRNACHS